MKDGELTDKQKERMRQMRAYLEEVRTVEREDFDAWFGGKKTVCTNIFAYLILIEDNE